MDRKAPQLWTRKTVTSQLITSQLMDKGLNNLTSACKLIIHLSELQRRNVISLLTCKQFQVLFHYHLRSRDFQIMCKKFLIFKLKPQWYPLNPPFNTLWTHRIGILGERDVALHPHQLQHTHQVPADFGVLTRWFPLYPQSARALHRQPTSNSNWNKSRISYAKNITGAQICSDRLIRIRVQIIN